MLPTIQFATRVPRSIQGSQFEEYHERESIHSHAVLKSQRGQEFRWARLLKETPPLWGQQPP